MTPTARTLKYLREEGWLAHVVEKYIKLGNMAFGRRIDAFGFGDLLACVPSRNNVAAIIALIQCCAGGDHARRRRKILGTISEADRAKMSERELLEAVKVAEAAKFWQRCGGTIMVISWKKKGPRGKPKRWEADVEIL